MSDRPILTPHPWLIRMCGLRLGFLLLLFPGGFQKQERPGAHGAKKQPKNCEEDGLR